MKAKPKPAPKTKRTNMLLESSTKKTSSDLVHDNSHEAKVMDRTVYRIHAHAQRLRDNRESLERSGPRDAFTRPEVVVVHSTDDTEHAAIFHEVHILGPSRVVHHMDNPLPGTDGRAVCWIETDAEIAVVYRDGGKPEALTREIWDRRKVDIRFLASC